jgi:hypothetical protein
VSERPKRERNRETSEESATYVAHVDVPVEEEVVKVSVEHKVAVERDAGVAHEHLRVLVQEHQHLQQQLVVLGRQNQLRRDRVTRERVNNNIRW